LPRSRSSSRRTRRISTRNWPSADERSDCTRSQLSIAADFRREGLVIRSCIGTVPGVRNLGAKRPPRRSALASRSAAAGRPGS
jgi:hypothetical protein